MRAVTNREAIEVNIQQKLEMAKNWCDQNRIVFRVSHLHRQQHACKRCTHTHSFGCDVELRLKRNRIRIPIRLRLYANCRYLLRIKWTLECLLRMLCDVCQTHVADAQRKIQKHMKQIHRELDRSFANLNAIAVASRILYALHAFPTLADARTHTHSRTHVTCVHRSICL